MFVRWRRRPSGRLSARLVHNQRVDGRVRQRHVGELGAISPPALDSANTMEGIIARRAFWRRANAALARFADRIDASLEATIRAALQAQVPMVTPNEQRRLSLLGAEREARFWKRLAEDRRCIAAGQEGQSTEAGKRHRVYQIFQWAAEASLRSGGAPEEEREFTAERLRKTLTDHGIRTAPLVNWRTTL